MKWVKGLLVCGVTVVAAGMVLRQAAALPPLEGRTDSRAIAASNDTPIGRAIAPEARANAGKSGVHLLRDGRAAYVARAGLAKLAARSIDAQYYIWHDDVTGTLLFKDLLAAAGRGVRVRLLLDDNNTSGLDRTIATLDAHPNIEVRLFNPFPLRRARLLNYAVDFGRLNRRMHNKSFTVDNQATIVGGRNIGDEYFDAGGSFFVDLDVLAIGPVVAEVSADFDRYWASASSYPARRLVGTIRAEDARAEVTTIAAIHTDARTAAYRDAARAAPLLDQLSDGSLDFQWAPVRMISDNPAKGLDDAPSHETLYAALRATLGEPQARMDLVSGYFVPGEVGSAALLEMAKRGVAVTVVTNAFEATDVPIVHAGYVKWRHDLLEAGLKIFEMHAGDGAAAPNGRTSGRGSSRSGLASALHAKTYIADRERVFVGSFNFDPRSANLNTELGFVIDSAALGGQMSDDLARLAPVRAYEVGMSSDGDLYWLDRSGGREVRHHTEPGTTALQRATVALLAQLPIHWLL